MVWTEPPTPFEYLSYRHEVGTLIPGTTPGLSSGPLPLLILNTTIKYIRYSTATCVQPFSITIKCEHHVAKCEHMMPKCVHLLLLQHHGRKMKVGSKVVVLFPPCLLSPLLLHWQRSRGGQGVSHIYLAIKLNGVCTSVVVHAYMLIRAHTSWP